MFAENRREEILCLFTRIIGTEKVHRGQGGSQMSRDM